MAINSQFLYFYLDELLSSQWVRWSERLLSQVPADEYISHKGFQELEGGANSSTRTRALDCFRLGLIRGKIVADRSGARGAIPDGWKAICDGDMIHTKLGYFAYTLGKALKLSPQSVQLSDAFDSLCSLIILMIGFEHQGRWFTTIHIFEFVRAKTEAELGRALSNDEIRYLSGALFNTLDHGYADQLLNAYAANSSNFSLYFLFEGDSGSKVTKFDTSKFLETCNDENFNINDIKKTKASLFWAQATRGIYTRARKSSGSSFLSYLAREEGTLIQNGQANILSAVYGSIYNSSLSIDLIPHLSNFAQNHAGIQPHWKLLMNNLKEGVLESLEYLRSEEAISSPKRFYIHDTATPKPESENIELVVKLDDVPLKPEQGCEIEFSDGQIFRIEEITENGQNLKLQLSRTPIPTPSPA